MSDDDLKVTDKRMFTADGELREEYRHLDKRTEKAAGAAESEPPGTPSAESPPGSEPGASREANRAAAPEPAPAAREAAEPAGVPRPREPEPRAPEARAVEPRTAEPQTAEPRTAEPRAAEPLAEAADGAYGEGAGESPRLEIPGTPEGLGAPTFLDLVSLLAEPIALYMGDVELPDGKSAENLDMARLHIDLLDVLRQKTAGNLDLGESRLLEDLLYRFRMRYVQKRG